MRRSSALVALLLAAAPACAPHEARPRLHVPDEPAPALAEWKGAPVVEPVAPVTGHEAAEPEPEPAPEVEPVKVVESPEQEAYERGKLGAREDIAAGQLGLQTFGYPASCRRAYQKILREEYGVELREVAGCVVNSEIVGSARGYNEVMAAEIERRHGAGALEKAGRKAGCGR